VPHNVIHVPLANGDVRTFKYRTPMVVDGIRREYKNGDPVTLRDIVHRPVKSQGTFPLRDMLNLRSVEALWVAYNRAEGKA